MILIKYKPIYKVSVSGEEVGYVENKEMLENTIEEKIVEESENIDSVNIVEKPKYELKLVSKETQANEEEIISVVKEDAIITYKYYEIALNNEVVELVDTVEEAEQIVNELKEENKEKELDLVIAEKLTENEEEVKTTEVEVAKVELKEKIENTLKEEAKEEVVPKTEEKVTTTVATVAGINFSVKPVSGSITSRYGVSSNIRRSTHTGLDIAAPSGTPIKAVAAGTVTFSGYSGSYGNILKVSHGNGVETWYAHCSKLYKSVGQKVSAAETIAAVGSTGNSTGNHLHLEIRINGVHVNPQNYLYK